MFTLRLVRHVRVMMVNVRDVQYLTEFSVGRLITPLCFFALLLLSLLLLPVRHRRSTDRLLSGHRSVSVSPQRGRARLQRLSARLLQPAERQRLRAVSCPPLHQNCGIVCSDLLPLLCVVLTFTLLLSTAVTAIRLAPPTGSVTSLQDSASVSPASPACTASAARSTSSASAHPDANVRTAA